MPFVTHADSADGGGGVASNFDDFVRNKLAAFMTSTTVFASGSNWTRSKADVNIGANEYEVFLTPPASLAAADKPPFVALHTKAQGVFMFPSLAFDTARPSYDQPSSAGYFPKNTGNNPLWDEAEASIASSYQCPYVHAAGAGPYLGHYLFAPADGKYCYAVIQCGVRKWRHLWIGNMAKYGSFTGGEFVAGHQWDQAAGNIEVPYANIHCPPGAAALGSFNAIGRAMQFRAEAMSTGLSWWYCGSNLVGVPLAITRPALSAPWSNVNNAAGNKSIGSGFASGFGAGLGTTLFRLNASLISGAKSLIPIMLAAQTFFDGSDRLCMIGEVPDVFRVNMKAFTPGQAITLGSFTYRLFPAVNSDVINTVANEEYSGYEGYAYRVRS